MKKNKQPILLITIGTVLAALSTMLVLAQQNEGPATQAPVTEGTSAVKVTDGAVAPAPAATETSAPVPAVQPSVAPEAALPPPAVEQPVATAEQTKPVEATAPAVATEQAPAQTDGSIFLAPTKDEDKDAPIGSAPAVPENADATISISLDDVALVDAVKMFTRISGANIMYTPSNLVGRVNVNLSNVDWKPALESILDMNGLGLIEKIPGSQVYTITAKGTGPEPLIVKTYALKYASVSNIAPTVVAMVPPPGKVSTFPSRNTLVVQTTSANQSEIENLVAAIDTIREQVFIEAKFMELTDSAQKDLGINWQSLQGYNLNASSLLYKYNKDETWNQSNKDASKQWDKRNKIDNIDQTYDLYGAQYVDEEYITPPASASAATALPALRQMPTRTVSDTIDTGKEVTRDIEDGYVSTVTAAKSAVLGAADFNVILSALKQMNGVSVVSNPKLLVANEEQATIHIGEREKPFVSSSTAGQQGIAPIVTYNPGEPVDTGVKLTVTPTVNTQSNITVKIEPELTRFVRNAVAPDGQTYPIISTKKIMTTFCLESGKTVAIGGLTDANDRETVTKVPILGDIPIIGKYLFTHTSDVKSQAETIIFVTVAIAAPSDIRNDTGLPEDTELTQKKMIEKEIRKSRYNAEVDAARADADKAISKQAKKVRAKLKNKE